MKKVSIAGIGFLRRRRRGCVLIAHGNCQQCCGEALAIIVLAGGSADEMPALIRAGLLWDLETDTPSTTTTITMRFEITAAALSMFAAVASASSPVEARAADLSQMPASSLAAGLVAKLPVQVDVNEYDKSSGDVAVGVVANLGNIPYLGSLPPFSRTVTVNLTLSGLSGLLPN
ncbi:uncharacterized protein KD926_005486 [Aspergillus affinis]|uniref:uncharacterized protein n=1 Tax=Aspergillus affinis TaxID=1070780 RepID=UPI0022FDB257|nr:uncharacterized protein KD926_005486 [Aspergillus affinis]KAI9042408.1 hypothetical protein KD926_005486 [Aspergillus affinis]